MTALPFEAVAATEIVSPWEIVGAADEKVTVTVAGGGVVVPSSLLQARMMKGAKDLLKQRWLQQRAGPSQGATVTAVREALRHSDRLAGEAAHDETAEPVFLLAVSWRTGPPPASTM